MKWVGKLVDGSGAKSWSTFIQELGISSSFVLKKHGTGWKDGWMGGWVDGSQSRVKCAYSNQ